MDETYDESYGQYSEQDYLGDGTAAGGQQIGTDADKGRHIKTVILSSNSVYFIILFIYIKSQT